MLLLAACMYHFNWKPNEFDLLSSGSLIGHLLECGTQVTGGNFTDWQEIKGIFDQIGYPIAEISKNGEAIIVVRKHSMNCKFRNRCRTNVVRKSIAFAS